MGGKDEHLDVRERLADLAGGFQTIEQRHGDIHDDHGGTEFGRHFYGLSAGGRFADHLDIALGLQELQQALPDHHVVFG